MEIDRGFTDSELGRFWAQFIALAPFVFQSATSLRNLGVLKALTDSDGPQSFESIRNATGLSDYSLSVLLDAGESTKLIEKTEAGFQVTEAGKYIEKDDLTRVNMNFSQDVCYEGLKSLEDSLRSHKPEGLKTFSSSSTIYEALTSLPEKAQKSWFDFDHYFSDDSFPRVIPLVFNTKPSRILDVGGNTGKFAIACATHSPTVRVTILDHANQLKIAKERISEKGFADRIDLKPIDLLDHSKPFPEGHDVIWMSQFLDCFGKEDVIAILKRAHSAMTEGSCLYVMETFTDKQRYQTAKFCLDMTSLYFTAMANGVSRMYPTSQFYPLIEAAGLSIAQETHNIRMGHSLLKIVRK